MFGDNGCGSVDCINEAASDEQLPTIVLDGRSVGLKNSIVNYVKALPAKTLFSRLLFRTATAVHSVLNRTPWLDRYMDSLPTDTKVGWFESILQQIPAHSMPSPPDESVSPPSRSCVVVWRVESLTSISEEDFQLWEHLRSSFPAVLFVMTSNWGPLSVNDAVPGYSIPLYVDLGGKCDG